MPFGEHLEELRRDVIGSLIVFVAIFVVLFTFFLDPIMDLVVGPVKRIFPGQKFIALAPFEAFFAYFKACAAVALFLASPVIFGLVWSFLRPGLYKHERRWVTRLIPLTFVLFALGVLFNYFFLVPGMLKVVSTFGGQIDIETQYSIEQWVGFILWFSLMLGLIFQLPLVLLLLQKIGIVSARDLAGYRKYAILAGFIAGAIITPGDIIVTEVVVGLVIAVLYEAGIWIGKIF